MEEKTSPQILYYEASFPSRRLDFISGGILGIDAKHVPHKYPGQEVRELGYLYNHIKKSLIKGYLGVVNFWTLHACLSL